MTHTTYEIRVSGLVPEQDLRDLGAVVIGAERPSTVLYGVRDQSALQGLLTRLLALGLEVVEIRQIQDLDVPPGGEAGVGGERV
jgi:hypothetical protein